MNKSPGKNIESRTREEQAEYVYGDFTPRTPQTRRSGSQSNKQTPSRSSKGLRLLSVSFCRKLRMLGFATYATIADELVEEFLGVSSPSEIAMHRDTSSAVTDPCNMDQLSCGKRSLRVDGGVDASTPLNRLISNVSDGDESGPEERPCAERTLRRRIYDIFNVLLATGTIEKSENGNVHWRGVPGERADPRYTEIRRLRQKVEELKESVRTKQDIVRDLAQQQAAFMNLIIRNGPDSSRGELERAMCHADRHTSVSPETGVENCLAADAENVRLEPNQNHIRVDHHASRNILSGSAKSEVLWQSPVNERINARASDTGNIIASTKATATSSARIRVQYPFVVLRTGAKASVGLETNEDRSALTLGVSEPFSVFSDGDSVTLLKFHETGPYSTRQLLHRTREEAACNVSARMAPA
ncbi:hypothetical protein CCYA_CCYA07G2041 [Cyanidiococcus yangmingshanensis]|nr:hypothetical protein CCYA_CCYA07G2041 [Cyanidiococcus yangmingshanensis]